MISKHFPVIMKFLLTEYGIKPSEFWELTMPEIAILIKPNEGSVSRAELNDLIEKHQ